MLDELWIKRLEEMGIDEIEVRSPITCETRHGICSTCYGRDLARGHRSTWVRRSVLLRRSPLVSRVHS